MYRLLRLFLQKSERAHAAAPPFQIEPAALGFDLVLGASLEAAGIYTAVIFHVGAKSALLRRLFMSGAKKTPSVRSLAPLFQIGTAALDYDLVSQLRCAFIACMKIWSLVALCLPAILLLFADCGLFMLFYLLLDMNFLSSFPHLRTTFGAALGVYSGCIKTSTSWQRDYRQIKVEKRRIRQKKRRYRWRQITLTEN
ncbi:Uncharacterised protein [uncultured Flavonifractor sp.]|nr:Uncharacterised protein [uncultured Flavonifractor sp.]